MKELIKEEKTLLTQQETIIEKGLSTFVEVGKALTIIRDNKLYREEYETFERAQEGDVKLYRLRPILARFMLNGVIVCAGILVVQLFLRWHHAL